MKSLLLRIGYFVFIASLFSLLSCEKDEDINTLSVDVNNIEFKSQGGNASLTIETNADAWSIVNPASDWLTLSKTNGRLVKTTITLSVDSKTLVPRKDTLELTAGNAKRVLIIVSQLASDYLYTLSSDVATIDYSKNSSSVDITITSDAPQWEIKSDASWLSFNETTGTGNGVISVSALANNDVDRDAIITITAPNAPKIQITVSQLSDLFPSYNTSPLAPDANGMSSNAVELAAKIKLGWNIGNSMEAPTETAWGNPLITKELIDLVKQSGFNAIRIPCSWNQHLINATTAQIDPAWLDRVKEVVGYCTDNNMYVLLNIHWDGGWLENNCTTAKQVENNAKQKALWEQIATHLRDFDEHLLFASANEPNVTNATEMSVLTSYHQTFINAVRATGGKNSYRNLVIQGPSTDIEKTNELMTTLPTDEIANHTMVEVHFYTPWNFCGLTEDASWGKMFYYWGKNYHSTTDTDRNPTWGEEDEVDACFLKMKNQFIDKGIPVLLGEYSPTRRTTLTGDDLTLHLASRAYYLKYVTKQARANGILPFYWDNGGLGNDACGLFNRRTNTVGDQQALDAVIAGASN